MKSLRRSFAAFAAISILAAAAFAADPSGTYTFAGGGGGRGGNRGGGAGGPPGGAPGGAAPAPQMSTLVLALTNGKLTGSITSPGRGGGEPTKTDISDASFKDDTVTFSVSRAGRDGAPTVTKYTGKVTADAITGTVTAPGFGGGEPMPREWVAKKGAPAAK